MAKTIGRLQKGTLGSLEWVHLGFAGGLNVNPDLQLFADNDLVAGKDVYLRKDGGVQMRNGTNLFCSQTPPSANPAFLANFYQDIRSGTVITPETVKRLAVINGNLYTVTSSAYTLVGSVGGSGVTGITWARIQDPNDSHFPSGLTDVIVICTGVNGPYVYDGTNLYTPAGWSQAASAQACASINGILWFGQIPGSPAQIFGTGDGITASMESLPGYRNFVMTSAVNGLVAQGSGPNAALVSGINSGLSVLYGTGPSTFYRQDIPMTDSVTASRSMVSDAGNIYFLGHNAEFGFDGVSIPQQISKKVEPWILNDPFVTGYPMVNNRQSAWACVYNNRMHLGYPANTATLPNTILCYDLVVKGWTVLVPGAGSGIASMMVLDAPSDPNPYQALVGCNDGTIRQWDFVPATNYSPAYDDAPSNTIPVLSDMLSRYFILGAPGTNKMLERLYPYLQVVGVFNQPITVMTDQGQNQTQLLLDNPLSPNAATLIWDVGKWDINVWGGVAGFSNFGPPATRCDFQEQADSFAFGLQMNAASAPWILTGFSAVYAQQGRT